MSDSEIHVGDIGTVFKCTIYDETTLLNISSATELLLIFKKSDGTILIKNADFYTDGTDGILQYITVTGDLDIAGMWSMQAKITLPGGEWSSNITKFKVCENL